jgi:hypothetical protein
MASGPGTRANAVFTLDGGGGEDFAVVSAGVSVSDCEHVMVV